MVPPLTLCAYMKKGPNLRWSLFQCSGGDEGDRTPDLLTASQALSQLSYAPVRRSTIRELPRRCKDNFGKLSAAVGGTRDVPRAPERRAAATPPFFASAARAAIRPTASPPAPGPLLGAIALPPARRFQKLCRFTGPGRKPPSMPQSVKSKPQVDDLRIPRNVGYGRPVRVQPRNPA